MPDALVVIIPLCVLSGVLAVAMTAAVMTSFTMGAIPGQMDEEFRTGHGITRSEALTMFATAVVATLALSLSFGSGAAAVLFAIVAAFGVCVAYTDLLEYLIFNAVVYPMCIATGLGLLLVWHAEGRGPEFLIGAVIGAAASLLIYLLQWVVSGYRLGFGDVRLSVPIGAVAGAFGSGLPLAAILFANLAAIVAFAAAAVAQRGRGVGHHIAFGPFMMAGLGIALLLRVPLMSWWDSNMYAVMTLASGSGA